MPTKISRAGVYQMQYYFFSQEVELIEQLFNGNWFVMILETGLTREVPSHLLKSFSI
jgi:hypothetical protein